MAAWLTYFAFVGTLTTITAPIVLMSRRSALRKQRAFIRAKRQHHITMLERELGMDDETMI